jgi:hypothetical protein
MKKALFVLLALPSILFAEIDPVNTLSNPKIILETSSEIIAESIQNDIDLCCVYEICKNDSIGSTTTLVIDKESGIVLGTIYGFPNKEFLQMLSIKLTPEYINDVVRASRFTNKLITE